MGWVGAWPGPLCMAPGFQFFEKHSSQISFSSLDWKMSLPGLLNVTPKAHKRGLLKFNFDSDDSGDEEEESLKIKTLADSDSESDADVEVVSILKVKEIESSKEEVVVVQPKNAERNMIKITAETAESKSSKKKITVITEKQFPLGFPHPPPTPKTSTSFEFSSDHSHSDTFDVPEIEPLPSEVKDWTIRPAKDIEKKETTKETKIPSRARVTSERSTHKPHFNIFFRWPSKVFFSIGFFCALAVILLQDHRIQGERLKASRLLEVATIGVSVDTNRKAQVLWVGAGRRRTRYLASFCMNRSTGLIIDLIVVCGCSVTHALRHCESMCKMQWTQPAATSLAFNSSSLGWNAQPPQLAQVSESSPEILIVWGETVAWIDAMIFLMHSWTIAVLFFFFLSLIWFVHHIHLNRRKKNPSYATQENTTGKFVETAVNIHQFPKMDGVRR